MEPLFPERGRERILQVARDLARESSALGSKLHPLTRWHVASLLRNMNSYYSNLIEGHNTHPVSIERALSKEYPEHSSEYDLVLIGKAHIDVEMLLEGRLAAEPEFDVYSAEFLCWLHREFYERLPGRYRIVEDPETKKAATVVPGKIRSDHVTVGRHHPPAPRALRQFLKRFRDFYAKAIRDDVRIAYMAAAHHRLAWIHPFLDGNGRITRLFTRACLIKAGVDGGGLWSPSRGLARGGDTYKFQLAAADHPRKGDLDGRGKLSESGLADFCMYFLETCLDQVRYMSDLLELDGLCERLHRYVNRSGMPPESFHFLRDAVLRGSIPRGEVARITGLHERNARRLLKKLIDENYLGSDTPRGPVFVKFPLKMVGYLFPRLYPPAVELDFGPH